MELLSNLIWIAVTFALWGLWLSRRRGARGGPLLPGSLLPGTGLQLIALAMLTVILLPVISVSDDLQASHNPAEVERTSIRHDPYLWMVTGTHPAPAMPALLASRPLFLAQGLAKRVTAERTAPLQPRGSIRTFWSRPPPIA
ncbi:MAG: hypothetical protein WBD46_12335 [Acidobacteriaceae bacterium]